MTFKEGLEMEQRIMPHASKIVSQLPMCETIDWHCGKGLRDPKANTVDNIRDFSGADGTIRRFGQRLTNSVQVSTGSLNNFNEYGFPRKSFTLRSPYNLFGNDKGSEDCIRTSLMEQYHYLLTGYELEPGVLGAYALIDWELFKIRFNRNYNYYRPKINVEFGFMWMRYDDLVNMGVIARDENFREICDFTPFLSNKVISHD